MALKGETMADVRRGRQTPTSKVVLNYSETHGPEAITRYNETGRTAQEWQALLLNDMLAYDDDGLWVHEKIGYSLPRRNGKNEIVSIIELYALEHGLRVLHTAHRTTTSHSASLRLVSFLDALGYHEVQRVKKGEKYEKCYSYSKQFGLERVVILDEGGGSVDFRTRSGKGGLGEGFDILVIDEAQEYTDDQESALKYVVSDSPNPMTIMCGTPPTAVSSGTVFVNFRNKVLEGDSNHCMWAEWGIEQMSDCRNVELWYEANPSLGTILTERKILAEVSDDEAGRIDFNIQRLGVWIKYNQASAISEAEWTELQCPTAPKLSGKMNIGIKYGHDGTNVAMGIALKTDDGRIFVEAIDCRPCRSGNDWILSFLAKVQNNVATIVVDGASGQQMLADEMKKAKMKAPVLPTVKEIIVAGSMFEAGIFGQTICHAGQPSLANIVSNCEKRPIGSNGGFGYKALKADTEIALMDCVILAHWAAATAKEKPIKQQARY